MAQGPWAKGGFVASGFVARGWGRILWISGILSGVKCGRGIAASSWKTRPASSIDGRGRRRAVALPEPGEGAIQIISTAIATGARALRLGHPESGHRVELRPVEADSNRDRRSPIVGLAALFGLASMPPTQKDGSD